MDVQVVYGDGQVFRLESSSIASWAGDEGHLLAQPVAHLVGFRFGEFSEQVGDDSFERLSPLVHFTSHVIVEDDDFVSRSIEQDILDIFREVLPWSCQ